MMLLRLGLGSWLELRTEGQTVEFARSCEPFWEGLRTLIAGPHDHARMLRYRRYLSRSASLDADLAATEANSNSSPSPSLLIIKRSTPSALHHSSHESRRSKAYLVLVRQHTLLIVSSSTPLKSESRPHPSGLHFYQSIVQPFK